MDEDKSESPPFYTLGEEIANSISHGIGAALAVAALSILVTHAYYFGDGWRILSFSLYGASLIFVFVSSTLYHAIQHVRVKRFFRLMDHAGIFLLIAGSYTPYTLVTLKGPFGWTLCAIIWVLALIGVVLKVSFMNRLQAMGHWMYLALGWIGLIALYPLLQALPLPGFLWLLSGGLLYSVGVIFYVGQRLFFNHFIWHLFVIAGALCHFFSIFFFVSPMPT